MTRKEFDAIVAEAVAAGADPKEAADYVVRGYKLPGVPKAAGTPASLPARKPKARAGKAKE